MLYFPDEGHWVLKPQNSQLWYETVGDWCDRWTHSRASTRETTVAVMAFARAKKREPVGEAGLFEYAVGAAGAADADGAGLCGG